MLECDLTGEPVAPTKVGLYTERVIHSVIYKMRPDVNAICHHHAPAIMPFCLADLNLRVVTQLGVTIGKRVPLWDQRDEFGATNHMVTREDEAVAITQCLGPNNMVLMKRHGATVVGSSMRELVFRSIYSCRDAELQLRALTYGEISVSLMRRSIWRPNFRKRRCRAPGITGVRGCQVPSLAGAATAIER